VSTTIPPDIQLIRSRHLLEADVSGEIVALDVEKGQCYGMNTVASRVWSLLSKPVSIDEICSELLEEFDVDSSTCREQITALIIDLQAEGLVQASA